MHNMQMTLTRARSQILSRSVFACCHCICCISPACAPARLHSCCECLSAALCALRGQLAERLHWVCACAVEQGDHLHVR